ncbi:MAG: hypothetical protein ACW98F_16125, partial [Candidatus Hodarchaeales archaeon]
MKLNQVGIRHEENNTLPNPFFFLVSVTFNVIADSPSIQISNNVINPPSQKSLNSLESIDYESLLLEIDTLLFPNIKSHIENFTNFGSRYTGYEGYNKSIEYITDFYNLMGLENITAVEYPLVIPLDQGSYVSLGNNSYSVYPLKPNSVHPSNANGLQGTLVYGGHGTYPELDGINIENSIVALEFNSGDNWVNVAGLGAKGVIFLNTNSTNRFEAEKKSIDIPLNFPRVYIDNISHSNTIKTQALLRTETITLYSQLKWKEIQAQNVYGLIQGE